MKRDQSLADLAEREDDLGIWAQRAVGQLHSGHYTIAPYLAAQQQIAAEAEQGQREALRGRGSFMMPGLR